MLLTFSAFPALYLHFTCRMGNNS